MKIHHGSGYTQEIQIMNFSIVSTRWFRIMTVAVAIVFERIAAHALGTSSSPWGLDLMAGSGLGWLAVWGIAHCDGLDGPVVQLAVKALDTGNVNYVLPWVQREDEPEIRTAFDHALSVRRLGPDAKALADRHFFETLVRVHRAGEGAPFTGLKPAGRDLGPAIPAADAALKDGSIERVIGLLSDAIERGVRRRFHEAFGRIGFAPDDVKAGREFVNAYVPYIHYVERLWRDANATAGHDQHSTHAEEAEHPH
jgi:hypothetical protein